MTLRTYLLTGLTIALVAACGASASNSAVCDQVTVTFEAFFSEDNDRYVTETEALQMLVADSSDQTLKDVGPALQVVAVAWQNSGFQNEQLYQANFDGVVILNDRCLEIAPDHAAQP